MTTQRLLYALILGLVLATAAPLCGSVPPHSQAPQTTFCVTTLPAGVTTRPTAPASGNPIDGCRFVPPHGEAPQPVFCLAPSPIPLANPPPSATPGAGDPNCRYVLPGRVSRDPVMCVGPAPRGSRVFRLTGVSGHQLALVGQGWWGIPYLVIELREATLTVRITLRPTSRGRFLVGVDRVSPCDRPIYRAHAPHQSGIELRGPMLMCPTRAHPPIPLLTVLRGTLLKVRRVQH